MGGEPRDKWDKLEILLKPVGGIMAAIAVASIGFFGSGYLETRQNEEMRTRLYTELISKREQSESVLRKDMFSKIIDKFLSSDSAGMEEKVLNLELLTYNFHESLNLKPLFNHLVRKLPNETTIDSIIFLDRLRRVAREIKNKQAAVLGDHGARQTIVIECPNSLINSTDSVLRPLHLEGFCLEVDAIQRYFEVEILAADSINREIEVNLKIRTPIGRNAKKFFADSICREGSGGYYAWNYEAMDSIQHVNSLADIINEELVASMADTSEEEVGDWESEDDEAADWETDDENVREESNPADSIAAEGGKFGVGDFDFPMIDNTRMGQMDHRLSIVLTKWNANADSTTTIKIEALCFPGSYASLKDRPYYDDIVNKLMPGKDN